MVMTRHKGFSLVELMIAILLASITAVVVLNVLTSYQRRTATLLGRNEAQINAAIALYSLEREVRMAGFGPGTPQGNLCAAGINLGYDGTLISDGGPMRPVRIIDGAAGGPDTIELFRSDAVSGAAPSRLVQNMADADANLVVDGRMGMAQGDLLLAGSMAGTKLCTLMQLTAAPAAVGSVWSLAHAATSEYNDADFTTPATYEVLDAVVNMGRYGVRRYGLVCNDDAAPAADNNCDLGWYDGLAIPDPDLADIESLAPQIVELQLQYGVSPVGTNPTVNEWVDATGAWANPGLAAYQRIKAVRIAIVARANREGDEVAPAELVLWDDDGDASTAADRRVVALDDQQRRFRYQVLTVVVPLINVIWADSI
jgi:type IV pilus assembly protein PilW